MVETLEGKAAETHEGKAAETLDGEAENAVLCTYGRDRIWIGKVSGKNTSCCHILLVRRLKPFYQFRSADSNVFPGRVGRLQISSVRVGEIESSSVSCRPTRFLIRFEPPDSNPYSVRVARLESIFDSGGLTRILIRHGSPDSNPYSIRDARLECLFVSGRPTRILVRFGSPYSNPYSILVARLVFC